MSLPSPHSARELDRSRAPAPGPLRNFDFPAIHRRTLSNGIGVLVAEVRSFPVVTLHVLLEAGGTREPTSQAGVASLTANLLESGAGPHSALQIAEQIEALGVQLDTDASWDTAFASLTALRGRLEPASHILAEIIQRPTFPEAEVERLRSERLAEILQRRADPRALAAEATAQFVYAPDVPFSRPLGGTTGTVESLGKADVAAFHADHFHAAATTMIVCGDFAPDEAVELLERRFGAWPSGAVAPVALDVRSRSDEAKVVVVNRPGSVQSEIRVGHLGVSRATPDYFAVVVMNTILGGAFSSRLNLNLRERHGYTYGASSGFTLRRDPGAFLVSTAVQTEVTAAAVAEIMRELRGIREAPVTPAELDDARNYMAGVFPLRLQTTGGIAARLAELAIYDLPYDYFDHYREQILEVSEMDVQRAAERHIRPGQTVVIAVGNAVQIREPLEHLELGPVQVLEAAEIIPSGA